jgi:hypothetical protein
MIFIKGEVPSIIDAYKFPFIVWGKCFMHGAYKDNLRGQKGAIMLIGTKSRHNHCLILCFLRQTNFKRI